ncbi:hypothetical protein [Streptomyces sp. NPDC050560]|uniref:hypothetical protein n=1 Tax=Streptomyces sp. NPDC050560 TaxID=3365630 RepID=UPI0037A85B20
MSLRRPVQCIKCRDTHVVVAQAPDKETGLPRWRYTCLDCRIAWWVDQHGEWTQEGPPGQGREW